MTMKTMEELSPSKECLKSVSAHKYICYDFETSTLTPQTGEIVGVAIATEDGAWWLPEDSGKDILHSCAMREDVWLIAHNQSFDYKWMRYKWGIEPKAQLICTMVMSWMLDENYKHYSLDHLVKRFFNHDMIPFESIPELNGRNRDDEPKAPSLEDYAKEDAEYCLKLFDTLYGFIKEQELTKSFIRLEMPVCRFIADMEYNGIKISAKALGEFRLHNRKELDDTAKEIFDKCGKKFLLTSPKQVAEVLFNKKEEGGLGLNPEGVTEKGKSGVYSTSSKVLKRLSKKTRNKVPKLILRHRELSKFMDSFTEPFIDLLRDSEDHRIYPSFHQVRTVTGRLSASKPNLQQMPTSGNFRHVFIPEDGRIFIGVDFSQIELRVLAHLSKEPRMMKAFLNGDDIHATTQKLMELPSDTHGRRVAKVINFGIVYGMGPEALSETAGISKRDANKFIEKFYEQYAGIRLYQDKLRRMLYKGKALKLLTGRLRRILFSGKLPAYEAERLFRQYFNSAIQGGAADIMGLAMRDIGEWIRESGEDVKCLAQIHDELLFSVAETSNVYKIYEKIVSIMQDVVKLRVPIIADGYIGYKWMKQMVCPKCGGKYIDDEDGEEKVKELNLFEDVTITTESATGIRQVVSSCCGALICRE